MAVRFRKYFKQCKGKRSEGDRYGKVVVRGVECEGKRSMVCPVGVPSPCGRWLLEFFDDHKQWVSLSFKDVRSKKDAERRLAMFISDRERGKLNLPKKKAIPTLSAYGQTYLDFCKNDKENTYLLKLRMVTTLTRYLGEYPLDKITPFIIETDVHPKAKNKNASKALRLLVFTPNGKFFSRDYSYVPTWQCLR